METQISEASAFSKLLENELRVKILDVLLRNSHINTFAVHRLQERLACTDRDKIVGQLQFLDELPFIQYYDTSSQVVVDYEHPVIEALGSAQMELLPMTETLNNVSPQQ